jgi:hypothetical protein
MGLVTFGDLDRNRERYGGEFEQNRREKPHRRVDHGHDHDHGPSSGADVQSRLLNGMALATTASRSMG